MAKPKPGKWSKICATLPDAGYFDSEYSNPQQRERVNARKSEIINGDFTEGIQPAPRTASFFMAQVAALRDAKKELKRQFKAVNLELEAYTQLMAEQYEAEGIKSLNLEDIGSVRLQEEPYSSTEDAVKVQEWAMKDADLRRKLTLPYPTLNAVVKSCLENGIDTPPGVKVFRKLKAVYTPIDGNGEEDE